MKPFAGYETTRPYSNIERLPAGGYVVKILDAEEVEYSWGRVLVISFDVSEGEQKGFFQQNYEDQQVEDRKWKGTYRMNVPKEDGSKEDEWTARRFRTDIDAIQDSNPGYHWDWNEKDLKGKTVGALFRNKEYEYNGRRGFFTECCAFTDVGVIRSKKYKMPNDKMLKRPAEQTNTMDDFAPIDDDNLPFS